MTLSLIPRVDNVLRTYERADIDSLDYGIRWYVDAHNTAKAINPRSRGDKRIRVGAGVIAALSPMNGWNNNVKQARIAIERGNAANLGLSKNCDKATRIINGEDPLDVLGGDKVRAFYRTIVDPLGYDIPVIDRHAFDIAVGKRTDNVTRSILSRKGEYERFGEVYIQAALKAGISASQMQAITWEAWRKTIAV